MIRKFTVRNYKNFKETLVLDFGKVAGYKFNPECITDGVISKCLLYGRNATGKTNLGDALTDIFYIIIPRSNIYRNEKFLNANSDEKYALFSYEFIFGKDKVCYEYKRNIKRDLVTEKLNINDRDIFDINFVTGSFLSLELELINAETIQVDRYLETVRHEQIEMDDEDNTQVPFLRHILNNAALPPDSILKKLEDFVKRMRISVVSTTIMKNNRLYVRFNEYLSKPDNLNYFEEFLNAMGIECKLATRESIDGQCELFFEHKTLIPFYENASSGTLTLLNFYRRLLAVDRKPSLFYMDEFDAYYNYEISEKIVRYLKAKFPESQIVLTTHNTNLMTNDLMRPDCLFILSKDGKITALCDATDRELREGHNLEKLYIGGEFEKYE